jgi:hypothetical protein
MDILKGRQCIAILSGNRTGLTWLCWFGITLIFATASAAQKNTTRLKNGQKIITSLSLQSSKSVTHYVRGLKLKLTRGPHQTQRKVSRAALKKWKKLPSNFQFKTKYSWKSRQNVLKFFQTPNLFYVRGPRVWDRCTM